MITKRFSLALTLPFKHAVSYMTYEHDFKNYHQMSASGLGDVRLIGHWWVLDPAQQTERVAKYQNIALGVGVQVPTGD